MPRVGKGRVQTGRSSREHAPFPTGWPELPIQKREWDRPSHVGCYLDCAVREGLGRCGRLRAAAKGTCLSTRPRFARFGLLARVAALSRADARTTEECVRMRAPCHEVRMKHSPTRVVVRAQAKDGLRSFSRANARACL
eukprot:4570911-Pleurochrysis_carterae.AAC.2